MHPQRPPPLQRSLSVPERGPFSPTPSVSQYFRLYVMWLCRTVVGAIQAHATIFQKKHSKARQSLHSRVTASRPTCARFPIVTDNLHTRLKHVQTLLGTLEGMVTPTALRRLTNCRVVNLNIMALDFRFKLKSPAAQRSSATLFASFATSPSSVALG